MKYLLIAIIALLIGTCANAQSIWRKEPKLKQPLGLKLGATAITDSIVRLWRFGVAVSPIGFTADGVYHGGAGTSIGYQVQDYNYATQTYTVKHSYNIVWVPLVTGQPITSINNFLMLGVTYGFDNNLIQLGPFFYAPALNIPGYKFTNVLGLMAIIGINLN